MIEIRRLAPADAGIFQALRLSALREAPTAFASSYEDEKDLPTATLEERLASRPDRGAFGAFEKGALVGLVGVGREDLLKTRHKSFIWGMYVAPGAREKGVGRLLLRYALEFVRSVPEVQTVSLKVNVENAPAIRLYESAGFAASGREPGAMLIDGRLHDELFMHLRL